MCPAGARPFYPRDSLQNSSRFISEMTTHRRDQKRLRRVGIPVEVETS
jgi:hypothetical protein